MKMTGTLLLELFACGALWAAQPMSDYSPVLPAADEEPDVTEGDAASFVIFSNLDSKPHARFNDNQFSALTIAGKDAAGNGTETWYAIAFSPEVDVQARTLAAAVGYTSGTKLVMLGLYSNNDVTGSVGDPLPGGQATTTRIPALGQCCQLTKVALTGDGVFLAANELYWLVVGPDNDGGSDFLGAWQLSNLAASANFTLPLGWTYAPGQWPAAEIRGTQAATLRDTEAQASRPESGDDASNSVIFSNLDRASDVSYLYGAGVPVTGDQVPFEPEIWQALPFTPKADYHAKTLAAAIALVSGEKKLNLTLYSDEAGKIGTPLPGGAGSTSDIPDLGGCCELSKVRLPNPGVPLSAGVQYWLVAQPGASTFQGAWQQSVFAVAAYQQPEDFVNWTDFSGVWLAAEIRGPSP